LNPKGGRGILFRIIVPTSVVSNPEARYFGGRSLVPLGEARLGGIATDASEPASA
jgi:hypothetical protein